MTGLFFHIVQLLTGLTKTYLEYSTFKKKGYSTFIPFLYTSEGLDLYHSLQAPSIASTQPFAFA